MGACIDCGEDKDPSEFYARPRTICKVCQRRRSAAWRRAHPDDVRRHNQTAIANYDRYKEMMQAYHAAHREEHREASRRSYAKLAADPQWVERRRAADRERRIRNPIPYRNKDHRRRACLRSGNVTAYQWRKLVDYFNGRCAYCMIQSTELTMDHIVPLFRGGVHAIENIVPACGSCNSSKRDIPLLKFITRCCKR